MTTVKERDFSFEEKYFFTPAELGERRVIVDVEEEECEGA